MKSLIQVVSRFLCQRWRGWCASDWRADDVPPANDGVAIETPTLFLFRELPAASMTRDCVGEVVISLPGQPVEVVAISADHAIASGLDMVGAGTRFFKQQKREGAKHG